jgi:hypothetical protein
MTKARKKIKEIEEYVIDRRDRAETRKHLIDLAHDLLYHLELENSEYIGTMNTLYNYLYELRQEIAKKGRRAELK